MSSTGATPTRAPSTKVLQLPPIVLSLMISRLQLLMPSHTYFLDDLYLRRYWIRPSKCVHSTLCQTIHFQLYIPYPLHNIQIKPASKRGKKKSTLALEPPNIDQVNLPSLLSCAPISHCSSYVTVAPSQPHCLIVACEKNSL